MSFQAKQGGLCQSRNGTTNDVHALLRITSMTTDLVASYHTLLILEDIDLYHCYYALMETISIAVNG